jgi:hypothetical protein
LRFLPQTLFGRTAAALLAAFLVFEALAFAVVWSMVIRPLAERSADDLAAKIILAAQTWVELPPQTRADYEMELLFRHNLELGEARNRLDRSADTGYFAELIESALSRRSGQDIDLKHGPDPGWDWLEIRVSDKLLRVGYDRQRYALEAPLAAIGIFLLGAALTVVTALVMARQSSRRLRGLAEKAGDIGKGRDPKRLPETGASEIRDLTVGLQPHGRRGSRPAGKSHGAAVRHLPRPAHAHHPPQAGPVHAGGGRWGPGGPHGAGPGRDEPAHHRHAGLRPRPQAGRAGRLGPEPPARRTGRAGLPAGAGGMDAGRSRVPRASARRPSGG